ncbi:pirin family protein [Tenacibaculum xiamenense]|uniref:pirin family protein n=1 Tax=Tenacibaculum xiamenense TaxID=1261553 RepID=UPI00389441A7
MSNTKLIIEERSRDIGDFLVGRLLPFRRKRMIGPFIFIDHMGPTTLGKEKTMSVDQHPHIGLATLTYLLSGAVMHVDSIGTSQKIIPGEVNLMVAGKGVTHTERTPEELKGKTYQIEGYQIWLALPKNMEDNQPEFHHLKSHEVPSWEENDLVMKLIVGTAFGKQSNLTLWSNLFMLEIIAQKDTSVNLTGNLKGEIGILVHFGEITACDEVIKKGHLLVSKENDYCQFKVKANSRLFVFGGQPFEEPRYIDWNFVSHDKTKIEKAKLAWNNKQFPKISNDNSYIPYPSVNV